MIKLYEHKWLSPQISFETRKSCSYVRYLLKMLAGCMILHNILKSKLLDSPLWSLHPGDMLDMYVGVPYTPTRSRITDHFYLNFMFTPWITGRYYDLDTLSRSQDEDGPHVRAHVLFDLSVHVSYGQPGSWFQVLCTSSGGLNSQCAALISVKILGLYYNTNSWPSAVDWPPFLLNDWILNF